MIESDHSQVKERRGRAREMSHMLDAVVALGRTVLDSEDGLPGADLRDPERLAEQLDLALGADGLELEAVLARLSGVLQATPSSSSWRFLNQLFGGRVPVATAAEMLAALPNVSMYTFKAAGAQVLVEREVLRRMAEKVGFPDGEGCFTPGGSLANLLALLLARNEDAPESRDTGVAAPRWTIYTSEEGHYSISKAAGILGLGRRNVRRIPVTSGGTMSVPNLAEQMALDRNSGQRPLFVNATAGTTVRGAFDPIREIAAVAHAHGAWLHVDGALGGSIAVCPPLRRLIDGAELADSYAWNPHKMMGVPLQTSVLLVSRRGALARSLDETADYLFQADGEDLNPGHRSIQCGRRNDALKLWAAWLHLGDRGWEDRVLKQHALARRAAEMIEADPELELAERPPSLNVCFRVRATSSEAVCERLDREGLLKIGHGEVNGRRTIRLVCVNPDLDEEDLRAILDTIKGAAREPAASEAAAVRP